MARRKLIGAAWAKSWQRSMAKLASSGLKNALRAARKAIKTAPEAARKVVRKTAVAARSRQPGSVDLGVAAGAGAGLRGGGDWFPGLVLGTSGARVYRLYRPPGLAADERRPLLLMLHGCNQTAASFAASTRMNRLAARERFWVLYIEQDRLANPQGCWQWFDTVSGRTDAELTLLLKVLDQVCQSYPVDSARLAVAGLSAGASMAALLALKAPQRFAAVAMHSGVAPGLARSKATVLGAMQGRRRATPLPAGLHLPPLLVIQGLADPVVAAANGAAAAALWANAASQAGASAGPVRSVQRGKRYPMTVTDFKQGRCLAVTRIEISRLGHAWSGGTAGQPFSDARGPDASRMVWAFVARQFRAAGTASHRPGLAGCLPSNSSKTEP